MKKFALGLITFCVFFICSCNNTNDTSKENTDSTSVSANTLNENDTIVIGHVSGDTITFTADSNTLRTDWQNFLNNQPEIGTCTLNDIQFFVNSGTYYLTVRGNTETDMLRSTMELQKSPIGCLYICGYKITCTTTDCSSEVMGCMPLNTACTECQNKGKCTKSSSNSVTIFPSIAPSTCY